MEIKTAGEIADAIAGGCDSFEAWRTEHSSKWVRKASVDAELEKVKEMLREASDVIGHCGLLAPDAAERSVNVRRAINKYLTEVPRG